jgi:hypothetical protein
LLHCKQTGRAVAAAAQKKARDANIACLDQARGDANSTSLRFRRF